MKYSTPPLRKLNMDAKPKKALFLLGGLDEDDLRWIVYKGKLQTLQAGEILIHEGKPITALYIVLKGTLKVYINPNNNYRELAYLSEGELVGEISFLDNRTPVATVEAVETTELLAIPRYELTSKIRNSSKFSARFYQGICLCLANRMRGTVRQLGNPSPPSQESEMLFGREFTQNMEDFLTLAEAKFNWLLYKIRQIN